MSGVIEHLEAQLGEIEIGFDQDDEGKPLRFQIVRFGTGSGPGTITFSTLGLGRMGLRSRVSDQTIHLEMLMIVADSLRNGPIPALLHQVGGEMLDSGFAVLAGDVVGPHGPLLPGSQMEAFYATVPVYFGDEFGQTHEGDRDVVFVWLVPISKSEADFVWARGWDAFEDLLVELDPDLTDLYRAPIVS